MKHVIVLLAVFAGLIASRGVTAAASNRQVETVDVSEVDQKPTLIFQVKPKYPPEMRRDDISGEVLVEMVVDTEGIPRGCKVVKSTRPEFEASAVAALSKWQFEPGMKHGRAVNTRLQVPVVYSLKKKKKH